MRFLVQVKSFFQLILLFVPSGLPLLLLLHTSNGFSLDPARTSQHLDHVKGHSHSTPAPVNSLLHSFTEGSTCHQNIQIEQPPGANHPALKPTVKRSDIKRSVSSVQHEVLVTSVTLKAGTCVMTQLGRTKHQLRSSDLGAGVCVAQPQAPRSTRTKARESLHISRGKNPAVVTETNKVSRMAQAK